MTEPSFADQISATGIAQRSGFNVPHDFAPPKGAALALQAALVLYIAIEGAVIFSLVRMLQLMQGMLDGDYASMETFYGESGTIESLANTFEISSIVSVLICIFAYCVFVYTAASNIQRSNAKGLDHSPGWSVGLSFIPIANLVFIFVVMRGIWKASHDPKNGLYAVSFLLPAWWVCYVGSNIAGNLLSRFGEGFANEGNLEAFMSISWYMIAALAVSILAALLLIIIVRSVTRAQSNWPALAAPNA
jgi:hypothetical protein